MVAGCGGVWQGVAGCGKVWRESIWKLGAIEGDKRVDDSGELAAVVDDEERCGRRARRGRGVAED